MRRALAAIVPAVAAIALSLAPLAAAAEEARPVGGPVVFAPAAGTVLELAGTGSFRGSLEVRTGLSVVEQTDIETYLLGLAEVPGSWPTHALRAQAVAARTYALWEREHGAYRSRGYDVCATVQCQVYAGAGGEDGESGRRWAEAVRDTRGEVLLYQGRPALARYHASDGGETLANETVFPRTGKLPYLKAIRDPPDDVAPLHTWEVFFTREAMRRVLAAALGLTGEVTDVTADQTTRTVTVSAGGRELRFSAPTFRRTAGEAAARLYPDLYPGDRHDGKRMPETFPSSRFTVEAGERGFTFDGRGYGHGVGMSQWGAKGRADRGDDYRDILASYYGGLRPVAWSGPARIRVGLVASARSVTVSGSGAFSVTAAGQSLASSTLGRWIVSRGDGRALEVRPPEGYTLPLVVSVLDAPDVVRIPRTAVEGRLLVSFVIPKAARVEARLDGVGSAAGVFEAGEGRLSVQIERPERLPSRRRYTLRLSAFDGMRRAQASAAVELRRTGRDPRGTVAAIAFAAAVLGVAAARTRRRRPPPQIP